jgi:hypothetical protein
MHSLTSRILRVSVTWDLLDEPYSRLHGPCNRLSPPAVVA